MKLLLFCIFLITFSWCDGETDHSIENNCAVGWNIGGMVAWGLDCEIRLEESFGIHLGGGLIGATLGVRYHIDDKTHSPFIGINIKDNQFGQVNYVVIQYGGTWLFTESDGLRYEFGLTQLITIDKNLEEQIYGNGNSAPQVGYVLGLGWAW